MEAVNLINQAAYGLMGDGRVDYGAMVLVWDLNNVPSEKRRDLFDKFLVYIRLQLEHMKNEMEKSAQKPRTKPKGMRG